MLAIVFWAVDGLILILIFCLFEDIAVALAIIEEAGHFIMDTWSVLFVPVFIIVAAIAYLVYWIVTVLYVYSVGEIT